MARREYTGKEFVKPSTTLLQRLAESMRSVISPPDEALDQSTRLAESSLYEFTRQAWHVVEPGRPLVEGWVIQCVAEHLEAMTRLEIRNLIINMPPGCMKSLMAAVMWPSWVWTRDPGSRWIFGSYGQGLAYRDSDRTRDVIQSDWYQSRWGHVFQLQRSYNTKERFKNTRQGYRIATTVAGKAMGERCDYACLPWGEVVWTEAGPVPIGRLVEGRAAVSVESFDTATGRRELKPVVGWHTNPGRPLVEVILSDGGRLVCTRDHRIWTVNRGWIEAGDLTTCDVLPGDAASDVVDRLAADSVGCGNLPQSPCVGEDGQDGFQCEFSRPVFDAVLSSAQGNGCRADSVPGRDFTTGSLFHADNEAFVRGLLQVGVFPDWPCQVFGEVAPQAAGPDAVDGCQADAVPGGVLSGFVGATEDDAGNFRGNGGPWPIAADWEGSVPFGVVDVVGPCSVFEVGQTAIDANAVLVSNLVPVRGRPDEGQGDALMNTQAYGLAVNSGVEPWVSVGAGRRLEDASGQDAHGSAAAVENLSTFRPDTAGVGNTVAGNSRYRSPVLIRHAGFSEKTYCLSVADYHTFVAGQGRVVISNCFDDPHKATEARSDAKRAEVIRAWTQTMSGRAADSRTMRKLVVMQRLHERDLCGYLLAETGGYEHLVLPMEYEPKRYSLPPRHKDAICRTSLQERRPDLRDEPEGSGRRLPGELLWPERFPEEEVEKQKNELQGVGSAGQLQQRPAAAEGNVFKAESFRHFQIEQDDDGTQYAVLGVKSLPEDREPLRLPVAELRFFQTADTAMTATSDAAYTCVGTFAWHRPTRSLLVWHVWRARLEVREQLPALMQMRAGQGMFSTATRTWQVPGHARPWPNPILWQGVENKSTGPGLIVDSRLEGEPIRELKAVGDKVQRAATAVNMLTAGKLWFNSGAGWLADFEDELLTFPNGAFKDMTDVLSYAALEASRDALLNAELEGELLMYPDPRDDQGRIPDPDDEYEAGETLDVGGVRVTFEDEAEEWYDSGPGSVF